MFWVYVAEFWGGRVGMGAVGVGFCEKLLEASPVSHSVNDRQLLGRAVAGQS